MRGTGELEWLCFVEVRWIKLEDKQDRHGGTQG